LGQGGPTIFAVVTGVGIMRRPVVYGVAVVWLLAWRTADGLAADVWRTDYAQAVAEADRLLRPLLVHFYGDHCPPCRKMEREVLHTRETTELLSTKFVAVKVDGNREDNAGLLQRFGVHGLPSDVIIDPGSGRVLSQTEGFQAQRNYTTVALQSLSRYEQSKQTYLARNAKPKTTGPEAASDSALSAVELGEPQPLVGLDGFSPVSLISHKEWTRGKPEYAWEHKGITYHLASRTELEEFRAKPEDFAPKLLGCDPVLLWETDRAVPGDTRYGAFFDGELYLFQTADTRKRFKANPPKFMRIQHVLRVDQIERIAKR
jgi:YHS domain-containing protein/thiol-disulfide isomerase/thioredoxin